MRSLGEAAAFCHEGQALKFVVSQLSYLLGDPSARRNIKSLLKYVAFLTAVIASFTVVFQVVSRYEGVEHSWLTGLYWTLTVMSTLGFGDITFQSDLGRGFSIVVLLAGVILLLVLLPFVFIRLFYAPWLEAQLRSRAPRAVPEGTRDHVLICPDNPLARGLALRLRQLGIPHFVIEPDPARAADLHADHIPVLRGEFDAESTYVAANGRQARAVVAFLDDPANTNLTLTVREVSSDVPVIVSSQLPESVDVLELAGATHVLPLKQRLGEQLANRVNARRCEAHVIGQFKNLLLAEFPAQDTPFIGKTLVEVQLRQHYGVNVVGVWRGGKLTPPQPKLMLDSASVLVVAGLQEQIDSLNQELASYEVNHNPVIVIGGGRVGQAASRALRSRGVTVHLVEHDPVVAERASVDVDRVFIGEGAELGVLKQAGIDRAPSVLLTTNDDATNIYLSIYCRRLNANLRIVSRVTLERNVVAIHRAGADFVLSYDSLARESVIAVLEHHELIFIGEGIGFFTLPVPTRLQGKTLAESGIGAFSGLNVIALRDADGTISVARADSPLERGSEMFTIGTESQYRSFVAES